MQGGRRDLSLGLRLRVIQTIDLDQLISGGGTSGDILARKPVDPENEGNGLTYISTI